MQGPITENGVCGGVPAYGTASMQCRTVMRGQGRHERALCACRVTGRARGNKHWSAWVPWDTGEAQRRAAQSGACTAQGSETTMARGLGCGGSGVRSTA